MKDTRIDIRARLWIAGGVVALYCASLVLPLTDFSSGRWIRGWQGFQIGLDALKGLKPDRFGTRVYVPYWVWVPWWLCGVSWFANPCIYVAVIATLLGRRRTCLLAATAALLLSLLTLMEAAPFLALSPAYWVWVASASVLIVASGLFAWKENRPSPWSPSVDLRLDPYYSREAGGEGDHGEGRGNKRSAGVRNDTVHGGTSC